MINAYKFRIYYWLIRMIRINYITINQYFQFIIDRKLFTIRIQ